MNPEDIGKAYDTITQLWQSDDFNRQNGIEQHRRAIAFTDARGNALDVGCGCNGRIIDLLLEYGFDPEGIDVSAQMIALAQQRHPALRFYHNDICEWVAPRKYDLITAWDSIWHVPLKQQARLLSTLASCLNSKGILIFSAGAVDQAGEHTDDYMGPEVYYASLGVAGFIKVITDSGCQLKHFEYDQYPELHSYFIAQKP
ncbi:class I SAM-dependent methyltransferase [Aestuariirhabdus sp. Z084]|uniref:class I SAM-dependent methyltransferase n=1 Tax=Aestuariirhabdus haliotis TaxID=2918751 RepID=UPI00201B3A0E|nr:class I SAM-dependent methyltransferase [Aestuariirhabdus haliotis]MCL6415720.1 class I SAM-dependent methyltransferase [Aestuariirhabdus haliotis]MCL6419754.1 class I SAM-dependent methyltransferase [Aestuariirhabdus haliotis]